MNELLQWLDRQTKKQAREKQIKARQLEWEDLQENDIDDEPEKVVVYESTSSDMPKLESASLQPAKSNLHPIYGVDTRKMRRDFEKAGEPKKGST